MALVVLSGVMIDGKERIVREGVQRNGIRYGEADCKDGGEPVKRRGKEGKEEAAEVSYWSGMASNE
jgi:hypothetical protein